MTTYASFRAAYDSIRDREVDPDSGDVLMCQILAEFQRDRLGCMGLSVRTAPPWLNAASTEAIIDSGILDWRRIIDLCCGTVADVYIALKAPDGEWIVENIDECCDLEKMGDAVLVWVDDHYDAGCAAEELDRVCDMYSESESSTDTESST